MIDSIILLRSQNASLPAKDTGKFAGKLPPIDSVSASGALGSCWLCCGFSRGLPCGRDRAHTSYGGKRRIPSAVSCRATNRLSLRQALLFKPTYCFRNCSVSSPYDKSAMAITPEALSLSNKSWHLDSLRFDSLRFDSLKSSISNKALRLSGTFSLWSSGFGERRFTRSAVGS